MATSNWLSFPDERKLAEKKTEKHLYDTSVIEVARGKVELKAYEKDWSEGYHVSIACETAAKIVKKSVEMIHGPMDNEMFGRNFYFPIVQKCFDLMTEDSKGKIRQPEDLKLSRPNVVLNKLESEIGRDVKAGNKIMRTQKVGDAALKLVKNIQKQIAKTLVSKFTKGGSKKKAGSKRTNKEKEDGVNDLVEEAVETIWNMIVPNFDKAKASAAAVASMSFKGAQMKSVTCSVMRDCLQGFADAAVVAKKEMYAKSKVFTGKWPAYGGFPALPGLQKIVYHGKDDYYWSKLDM